MKSTGKKATPNSTEARLRVAVVGATGYAGVELVRILLQHPRVALAGVTSQQFAGKRLSDIYPSLAGTCDLVLEEARAEKIASQMDLAFTALPHGASMEVVARLLDAGKRVIDLSADFRLHAPEVYGQWYRPHEAPHLLRKAVYGLTEIHRDRIPRARLVATPGCYPTGAVLGLAPLFAAKMVQGPVVIDAKSGVTGAGRSSAVEVSFCEVNENFKAYQVGVHRHIPEIEQELSELAQAPTTVLFTPHLVPMNRGILSTMYVDIGKPIGEEALVKLYRHFYRRDPFIRILAPGRFPETKETRGSNDCAIGFRYDSRVGRLIVITALDNLVKGAAGQAVQNMNLMYGFDEVEGLRGLALVP
ncbi:MAG: N-acetyl-gamma-glutamyl-phosphate reductase [Candidatus Binatia bacterium]